MLPKMSLDFGKEGSLIRDMAEYGNKRKTEIGEENVFDFTIGNPSIPAPEIVTETLKKLITEQSPVSLHGYTSAPGDKSARTAIADYLNRTYAANESADFIYITCGASASLSIALNAVLCKGDEVILLSPYFSEYRVFIEKAGGKAVCVPCDKNQRPDTEKISKAINKKTKAIIINSPNNPTGAVYTKDELEKIGLVLQKAEKRYKNTIYCISDEPYRELVYDGVVAPYTPSIIPDTISCYSFSKSLSLPGERIGYICVSENCYDKENVFSSICGSGRMLGFVCAPSMFQKAIPYVIGHTSDISLYDRNRKLLYEILKENGFSCIYPEGAFYMFVKVPYGSSEEFCERAKAHELLFVCGDEFGTPGFVRIAYCVSKDMILRSKKAFTALGKEYFKNNEKH